MIDCKHKEHVLEFCHETVIRQGIGIKDHIGETADFFVAEARNGTGRPSDGRENSEAVRDIDNDAEIC